MKKQERKDNNQADEHIKTSEHKEPLHNTFQQQPDTDQLIEELHSQQIELEFQNQQLIDAQSIIEEKSLHYSDLFNEAPISYLIVDVNAIIIDANIAASELFGYTKDRLTNLSLFIFIPQNQQHLFSAHLAEVGEHSGNKKIYTLTIDFEQTSGKNIHAQVQTTYLTSQRGYQSHFRIAITDITEVSRMQNELRESRTNLDIALTGGHIAWWKLNYENGIVEHAPGKATMLGYTVDEFPKHMMEIMKLVHPEDYEPTMQAMRDHILGKKDLYMCDYRIRTKSGGFKWYHDRGKIVEFKNGKPSVITGFVMDISDRKHLENELHEMNFMKDRLINIMAHDLKSPFTLLMGMSEMLELNFQKYTDDKKLVFIKSIGDASKRAYNLLATLLDWSYAMRQRLFFNPKLTDLHAMVDEKFEISKSLAIQKNIQLINKVHKNTMVFADENMLKTILQNLISNAIKFSFENGEIIITAHKKQNQYEVAVIDFGTGIPGEYKDKLFAMDKNFTTLGTAGEKGTGMGLLICKEFVQKHNGNIWVESNEEAGCRFVFSLPNF